VIKERRLSKAPLLFNTLRKLALVRHEFACLKTRFGGITPDVTDAVCEVPRIANKPIEIVTLPKIACPSNQGVNALERRRFVGSVVDRCNLKPGSFFSD